MGTPFEKLTPKLQNMILQQGAAAPKKPAYNFGPVPVSEILLTGPAPAKKRRAKAPGEPSESQIQQQIMKWWALHCLSCALDERLLMAFPLQGLRTKANGARMKAEGMRAGTPDMFLAVPRNRYHGLWIELKRPSGRPTATQKAMLTLLDLKGGYVASTAFGFDDCQRLIVAYLNGETFF